MKSHHESEHLVIVARAPYEAEASPIVDALEAAGIPATMTGGFTAGFIAEAPGDIQIKVLEHDWKRAKEVLREARLENENINWETVDVGEPVDD